MSSVRRHAPWIAAAVVLAGCASSTAARTDASITTIGGVTRTTMSWNVPTSRSEMIARAQRIVGEDEGPHTVRAKLMTYGDFRRASEPHVVTPGTPDSLQIWAVEVTGKLDIPMAGPSSWAILTYDAHNGSAMGFTTGPHGTSPTYWNDLPDHSSP